MQGIYGIYNRLEHKWYIGSSLNINKRKSEHFSGMRTSNHDNERLLYAVEKYGLDSFDFFILEEVVDENTMYSIEELYIKEFDSYYSGYNKTDIVLGSSMQNLSVRQKHWGPLHGDSKYSAQQVQDVLKLLADTDYTYKRIDELTGVDMATVSYIKTGGHEWVHIDKPDLSVKASTRISKREKVGIKYTDNQIIEAFALLLNKPEATFAELSKSLGVSVETISAISTGRQYKELIAYAFKEKAESYFSLGKLEYSKKFRKMTETHMSGILALEAVLAANKYLSRDKLKLVSKCSDHTARLITELDVDFTSVIIKGGKELSKILAAIKIIGSKPRATDKLKQNMNMLLSLVKTTVNDF